MELQQQGTNQSLSIQTYNEQFITLNQAKQVLLPCLISCYGVLFENDKKSHLTLASHITNLQTQGIQIILIGGKQTIGSHPNLHPLFSVEYMNLGAACYAFNILLSENRPCALYLNTTPVDG